MRYILFLLHEIKMFQLIIHVHVHVLTIINKNENDIYP